MAVKAVLITLGAAFILLSVVEWKKFIDLTPTDDGTYTFAALIDARENRSKPFCTTTGTAQASPADATKSLAACTGVFGNYVEWGQAIKAFVYSWIGIGLLVAAFVKPKGVSGGW